MRGEVDIDVLKDLTIRPCRQFTDEVEAILDYKAVSFAKKSITLAPRKKRWNGNKIKAG